MKETRRSTLAVYFGRMRGAGTRTTTPQPISVLLLTWGAAAIGIFLIAIPSLYVDLPVSTRLFLIGSFGASAALLYGAPHSDFAQPRNLVVGQVVAALVGVTAYKVLGAHVGLAGALAVATTIAILQLLHSLHPPAGATALIAVLGPAQVHRLGYLFVLTPVLTGSVILLIVAVIMNNLSQHANRRYPTFWW
jgi:CBS-domain-containing membrane protein